VAGRQALFLILLQDPLIAKIRDEQDGLTSAVALIVGQL
jgi:hypothetical protein